MDCVQRGNEEERGVVEQSDEQPQKHAAPHCTILGVYKQQSHDQQVTGAALIRCRQAPTAILFHALKSNIDDAITLELALFKRVAP
ncbi:predicted protein [Histoplasma capsulatum H143]|uniref:Uncharacterized protein n=1 Tax=Ajellomyces capsulatus (strain H143) TaxID=544712 RepID=C6H8G7_AJECH|nr:predicted protein [Histoplasma capsulatum H143]